MIESPEDVPKALNGDTLLRLLKAIQDDMLPGFTLTENLGLRQQQIDRWIKYQGMVEACTYIGVHFGVVELPELPEQDQDDMIRQFADQQRMGIFPEEQDHGQAEHQE